jgi:hypothetical protein
MKKTEQQKTMEAYRKLVNKNRKRLARVGRQAPSSKTLHVISDDFPPDVEGRIDPQTGIRLETKSQYRRAIKNKGLCLIGVNECNDYDNPS